MKTAACVSGFLLLFFITDVHLSPDPKLLFEIEGGKATFNTWFPRADDHVLYRVLEDGDLLLVNCSQRKTTQPDGYRVKCFSFSYFQFKMYNLTLSHSGDYRAEVWRGGNITQQKSFRLSVCVEGEESLDIYVEFGDSAVLCRMNSTDGSSLQVYSLNYNRSPILVLDTNSSLEPLVTDLQGRLQFDLNTSVVTLSEHTDRDYQFYCTVRRGAQCQSFTPAHLLTPMTYAFGYKKQMLTLPCISKRKLPDIDFWTTPAGEVRPTINQTQQQEVMYMLEDRQTGNCSLIIPCLSLQNSGRYSYRRDDDTLRVLDLFVCTEFSPLDVIFSHDESVHLDITEHLNESWSNYEIHWSRQKSLQPQVLILDTENDYLLMPVDLRGRVSVIKSLSNSSLTISNLTAEDSGIYAWRVYGKLNEELISAYFCCEGTFRLLYRDPFGVHSPFYRAYAPLIGCALLGLVTAVIWFRLRSRRGEQTSGPQSRAGQHSGDEDLYDDIEMVELNMREFNMLISILSVVALTVKHTV